MLFERELSPPPLSDDPFPEGESSYCIYESRLLISGDSHPITARFSRLLKSVGYGLKIGLPIFLAINVYENGPELKYFIFCY